ncbi:MAG: hypothetical protein QNM02_20750 [Acidimicrobiia bacterium]|nr:hypothetical protein [Acidimicrobiia bacterium]
MFFWFIGTAVVSVGFVFRDPRFDYRLLIVGSVLPVADGLLGGLFSGARPLHSLTVSVLLLAVLMLATRRGGPTRRLVLGLPIGMILHLVFDGAWTDTEIFWWPFTGLGFDDEPLPMVQRAGFSILLEIVGVLLCGWLARMNSLLSKSAMLRFLHDGQLAHVPGGA